MKHIALLFLLGLFIISCNNSPQRPEAILTPEQVQKIEAEAAAALAQKEAQAAAVSAAGTGLPHYYCTTHPANGADAAGSCSICGNALVHNQAFHNTTAPAAGADAAITPPGTPEPAINAAGVFHYTCPNGHTGGGGSATPCAECGTTLVHNTAYHDNNNTTTPSAGANPAITPPATTPEPAVNAAGVFHYTCPNGHAGGGGSATPCGECGTTLVHNTAYHN